MAEFKFRNLRADEIEVRIADKKNGYMNLLLYQDARCGQRILDETLGSENWAVNYKREGDTLLCGIGIFSKTHNAFIWKWNAGAPSNFEAEKGEASDAFKRACTCWNIGRELYSAPKIRIPESPYRHKAAYIDYDDKGFIKDLQITDSKGNLVFNYMDFKEMPLEEADRVSELKKFCRKKVDAGENATALTKFYNYYSTKINDWHTKPDFEKLLDKWMERE